MEIHELALSMKIKKEYRERHTKSWGESFDDNNSARHKQRDKETVFIISFGSLEAGDEDKRDENNFSFEEQQMNIISFGGSGELFRAESGIFHPYWKRRAGNFRPALFYARK